MIRIDGGKAIASIDDLDELAGVAEDTAAQMAGTTMPVADYVAGYAQGAADVLKMLATGGRESASELNMVLNRRRVHLGAPDDDRKVG